ncbi:RNA polymerase sigma factor [Roseimaritima ulvae]|uniref:RNA polymerase sigma factor n=2 Tax=Roseimaritima ulvae TaxID=980254 RepID=A0A5B9R4F4_9BACT|nr:RNA polymerase sigma factor [Roseimaritima ulvae]
MDDDESALAEILTQYGASIIGFLVAKYDDFDHADAQDVLSIAIGKLWKRRHQYKEEDGRLRPYLFKIADNTAKDIFRTGWKQAQQLPVDFGEDNNLDLLAEDLSPAGETKRQRKDRDKRRANEIADLKAIISQLPEKEQQIVWSDAHAKDRVSDSGRLADELGIALGSVRGYRSRAWKTIRSKMKELGYELPPEGETDGK